MWEHHPAGGGQNRLGADLAACTWPNGLMVERDALSQSLKIRAKKPETAEGTELRATKGSNERRGACC